MRKRGIALLGLVVALMLGLMPFCSLAATGWAQENGYWVYYDSNGSRLYNVWRQGSDGYWRYLNSSGVMATDSWVEDDNYYVDSNGIMITSQWLKVQNDSKDSGYDWYYFGETGKNVKGKWQQIDGNYYHFDDAGAMETGWILDDMYYCDEYGVMLTGWQRLEPPEGYDYDFSSTQGPYEVSDDDGKCWFYFSTTGKKTIPSEDSIGTKKINGSYYALDEYGAVQYGWVCTDGDESEDIADYRYVGSDGKVVTGWYSMSPPDNLSGNYDYDVEWFYFNSKGVPKTGPTKGSATTSDLEKISGNTYLFNEYGTPVYGLQQVYSTSGETYYSYYFGTRKQSSMLKGKQKVDDGDGSKETYYFNSSGKGYTGVYDDYLYYKGKLQKADSDSKYQVITIYSDSGNTFKNYVVNTSGKVMKSKTVKDGNSVKYKTSSTGILTEVDDEAVDSTDTFDTPEEPNYDWQ